MNKAQELVNWYEGVIEDYVEAVQIYVADMWQDKYEDGKALIASLNNFLSTIPIEFGGTKDE